MSIDRVNNHLPLAPVNCEQLAMQLFPIGISPEEYAARYFADWFCFSFHRYCYRDCDLDSWIQRLGEIFSNPELLSQCQAEFLTEQELVRIKKRLAENFKRN